MVEASSPEVLADEVDSFECHAVFEKPMVNPLFNDTVVDESELSMVDSVVNDTMVGNDSIVAMFNVLMPESEDMVVPDSEEENIEEMDDFAKIFGPFWGPRSPELRRYFLERYGMWFPSVLRLLERYSKIHL